MATLSSVVIGETSGLEAVSDRLSHIASCNRDTDYSCLTVVVVATDLSGEGKRRSQWNQALLADVVAPLYADLIMEVTKRYPSLTSYFDLFPAPEPTAPNFRSVMGILLSYIYLKS